FVLTGAQGRHRTGGSEMYPRRDRESEAYGSVCNWRSVGIAGGIACVFSLLRLSPALAVDQVIFSGNNCFHIAGSNQATANADTCVGTETNNANCSGEQAPSWPADWDALLFPSLTTAPGTIITPTPGGAPGAGTFTLPWGGF